MIAAPERLNRFLARRGVTSRRGADALIEAGRVRINEGLAVVGAIVDPTTDDVTVDGRPVTGVPAPRTLMLNKPVGVLSTRADPQRRPTVMDLVDDPGALVPVGRLDRDSRGLLLLTTDGELAFRLTHPRHRVEKRYRVRVAGVAPEGALRRLSDGVELDGRRAGARSVSLTGSIGGDDVIEVVMEEGRNREVRRMCAAVGLRVRDLERVAVGPLVLGRLAAGTARPLRPAETAALYSSVGLAAPPA